MGLPDRTIDIRHRLEPRLRLALSGWYDPDSVSFDASAHEAARKSIVAPRRDRDPRLTNRDRA